MLHLSYSKGGLAALVLGFALACGLAVAVGRLAQATSEWQKKQEKEIEEALYRRLREDGCIKGAKCRYELSVKRVVGRKLIDLEFRRRDKSGNSCDVVARARQAELRVNLPAKQLLVHMQYFYITSTDPEISTGYIEDKVWSIDLQEIYPDFEK